MLKIDPAFLFELGPVMRKIREVNKDTPIVFAYVIIEAAGEQIGQAVDHSIYSHAIRSPTRASAHKLLDHIRTMLGKVDFTEDLTGRTYGAYEVYSLDQLYGKFETLFLAELQAASLYLVSPKGGYDTPTLIERGEEAFGSDLAAKVPVALSDIRQAMRCIAFELPTAAGFHLHRAHESVLRIYWDNVTGRKKRPRENNMGVYLRELDKLKAGREQTRLHLRSIKDFHRNPLMHPEQALETVDEAIDLQAAIRSSIGYMLREIPAPPEIQTVTYQP
jgi:hypothetical protein